MNAWKVNRYPVSFNKSFIEIMAVLNHSLIKICFLPISISLLLNNICVFNNNHRKFLIISSYQESSCEKLVNH